MIERQSRALVVEDNPVTRKVIMATLEADGFEVEGAADGAAALELAARVTPDVILVDFVLPDFNGDELLARLRRASPAAVVPVILLTGLASKTEQPDESGFAAVLLKPVHPSSLIKQVRAVLSGAQTPAPVPAAERRLILVIEDMAINRKLMAARLELAGFAVRAVDSVEAGLTVSRARQPDAILADVMMPGLDGFQLCLAVRRDPLLESIPIVLVSSMYFDAADEALAINAGASSLLPRTPDLANVIPALRDAIELGPRPLSVGGHAFGPKYIDQLRRQVASQLASARQVSERGALQASTLSLLAAMSQLLATPRDLTQVLGDVLVHSLDASGLSVGILYVCQGDGSMRMHAATGLTAAQRHEAAAVFGVPAVVFHDHGEPRVCSQASATPDERRMLHGLGQPAALVVPFTLLGRHYGTLLLASDRHLLDTDDWQSFARTLATQFAQVIALGQSMARLSETSNRVQTLMDGVNDAIAALTPDGVIRDVNRRMLEMLGRPQAAVVGHRIAEFTGPTETAKVEAFPAVAREGHGLVRDVGLQRLDGSIAHVDFSMSTISVNDEQLVLASGRDMTEERRLAQQLVQAQKMEAVGRLAAGVAHDFNNILTSVLGHAELILEGVEPGSALDESAREVMKAGQRASGLTRQLLAFSRQELTQPKVVSPNELISELEKMLRRLIGASIVMETRLASTRHIMIDPGQFEQILLNLAANARDAMEHDGRLLIETSDVEVAAEASGERPHGEFMRLRVTDSGCGMTPEVMSRIFEPFFTTKKTGHGTGLGLSTVHDIVRRSRAVIRIDSEPGAGTSFTIDFPAVAAEIPVAAAPPVPAAVRATRPSTILLAEDDAALRTLATNVLERVGYRVLAAGNAASAAAIAATRRDEIALLITDVIMPGGNGKQLADELVAKTPGLRVLFTSGYTADIIGPRGVLEAGVEYLPKPFTPAQLRERVRQLLEAA